MSTTPEADDDEQPVFLHEAAEIVAHLLKESTNEPLILETDAIGFTRALLEDLSGTAELKPAVESLAMLADDLGEEGCPTAAGAIYDLITEEPLMKALLGVDVLPALHESATGDQQQKGQTKEEAVVRGLRRFSGSTETRAERTAEMHGAPVPKGAIKLKNLLPPARIRRG